MSFLSALAAGYTAEQVFDLLQGAFPALSKKLRQAKNIGYDVKQIFSMLEGTDKKKLKELEEKAARSPQYDDNPYIQGQKKTEQTSAATSLGNAGKALGTAALGAAGLYGASKLLPSLAGGIGSLIDQNGKKSQIGPAPMSNAPVGVNPEKKPEDLQGIPETPEREQFRKKLEGLPDMPMMLNPSDISLPSKTESDFPHLIDAAQKSLSSGNTPEQTYDRLKNSPFFRGLVDKFEKENGFSFLGRIKKLKQPDEQTTRDAEQIDENIEQPSSQLDETKQKVEKQIKPVKGDIVFDEKSGISGELKDIRNKEALIDDNGKIKKVSVEDLRLPDEDVRETVSRLLEIPEIDRSSNIALWSYDPQDNELLVLYHNGSKYKYLHVPEEIQQEIKNAGIVPKTEGQNIYGAWSQDQVPEFSPSEGKKIVSRGATLSKLIINHPLYKKSKKGEKPNPNYRKLEVGYDYYAKLRSPQGKK
jgi:hypothetical protein